MTNFFQNPDPAEVARNLARNIVGCTCDTCTLLHKHEDNGHCPYCSKNNTEAVEEVIMWYGRRVALEEVAQIKNRKKTIKQKYDELLEEVEKVEEWIWQI